MKLLIKNLTGQPVSTPVGTLQPGSSLSHEVPESQLVPGLYYMVAATQLQLE